ncbi:MAG: SGNH/GDSL hydrolase family protein [Gemmataceae bacterium]
MNKLIAMSVLLVTALPAVGADKPRVLIIGDSISIGYTPVVAGLLKDQAEVVHSPGNAQTTRVGLKNLKNWLGEGKWDVIHVNWGLWDLRRPKKDATDVPIEEYEKNLRQLLTQLKETKAKVIWGSTTPVNLPNNYNRRDEDVQAFNAAAKKVCAELKIPIDDLYTVAKPDKDKILVKDGVHFTKEGYQQLGAAVAEQIKQALK